jgi:hypothetical protein
MPDRGGWHDGLVRWRSRSRLGGNARRRRELAAALAAAGFWEDVPGQDAARQRAEVAAGASPLAGLYDRGWMADGKDLAEGDVEELLLSMADALRRCGAALSVESVRKPRDDSGTGYALRINGRLLDLIDFDPADPRMPLSADPWMDCTVKPLSRVIELLAEAGSRHRVAVINAGGNDGLAVLLPLAAIRLLTESELVHELDRPVVPTPAGNRANRAG